MAFITATAKSTGIVSSVALTAPSILSVSGSPITSSGTIALTLANQTANTVFAGPTSGGAAGPTFRALVAGDIPSLTTYLKVDGSNSPTANVSWDQHKLTRVTELQLFKTGDEGFLKFMDGSNESLYAQIHSPNANQLSFDVASGGTAVFQLNNNHIVFFKSVICPGNSDIGAGGGSENPGNIYVGSSLHIGGNDSSACLEASSTTQGFLPPVMGTTDKNAISSPATGLIVFDTDLGKLCVYTGAAWETIVSA